MQTMDSVEIDHILADHWQKNFGPARMAQLQEQFTNFSIAVLPGFCPPSLLQALQAEASDLLDAHGVTRDFLFKITDNTPRHMTTVGQSLVHKHGNIIPALYQSSEFLQAMARIARETVYTCPYPGERYVVSSLTRSGDTHGWHWDDYSLGFVWVLEAPEPKHGGFIQCCPNTSWDKENPDVHGAFLKSPIYSYALAPGDAYFLKTDTTLHRVYPIRGDARRVIINMTWANECDLSRPMTHETNDVLFGDSADIHAVGLNKSL